MADLSYGESPSKVAHRVLEREMGQIGIESSWEWSRTGNPSKGGHVLVDAEVKAETAQSLRHGAKKVLLLLGLTVRGNIKS